MLKDLSSWDKWRRRDQNFGSWNAFSATSDRWRNLQHFNWRISSPLVTDTKILKSLTKTELVTQAKIWQRKYSPGFTYSSKSKEELLDFIKGFISENLHKSTIACVCGKNVQTEWMIDCSECFRWSHCECVEIPQISSDYDRWLCHDCTNSGAFALPTQLPQ